MTATERAGFRLERLEWSAPNRVEVAGRWHGVPEEELLWPALVVRGADEDLRVPALWKATDGRGGSGLWEATFLCDRDRIHAATLELGGTLAVELPPVSRARRRFGRPTLEVRHVANGDDATDALHRLQTHTEVVVAREELQAAREETRRAHEEAERARKDRISERDRAKAESSRMRDALLTSKTLAERAVKEKDAVNRLLKMELADVRAAFLAEQERSAEAERRHQQLQEESAAKLQDAERLGHEVERLRASIEATAAERDSAVQELRGLREALEAEHAAEVAGLRQRVEAAERAAATSAQGRADLEQALQQARERSELLAARLAAVRQAVANDLGG